MSSEILDDILSTSDQNTHRRRDLLPIWIKIFIWLFLILSFFVPVTIGYAAMGNLVDLSIYGLTTYYAFSLAGIFILFILGLKGIVAFGLWTEREWAVRMAIIDAYIGIFVCIFMMFVFPFLASNNGNAFTIRLELVALVPYLLKMLNIKKEWSKRIKRA